VNAVVAPDGGTTGTIEVPSTIFVPVDRAELAARAATIGSRWARAFGAELVVLSVADDREHPDPDELVGGDAVSIDRRTVPGREALVPAVRDATATCRASAVCVATRARSPLVDVVLDDVAQEMVRGLDVPVMLIGPHCTTEPLAGPVVIGHDGSRDDDSVIEPARVWAAGAGLPVVLLHVHQLMIPEPPDSGTWLREVRDRLGSDAAFELVRHSFPAGAIREYAREVDASLLALSTRGRTDTLTASTGSTATWVVRESPCPVLVAHPPARGGV
jgi:nucleotide-binding universal stress UspA family protein